MDELVRLVIASQRGDPKAFGRIVFRFQDAAYASAYGWLGDSALAEEATQDAFIEAYLCLSKLREPVAFPLWFRRIIFKRCNRLVRGGRIRVVPLEEADEVLPGAPDPVEEREMREFVRKAVEELPAHERVTTALFYLAGYTQSQIAAFLEVPVTTVKKRLHDARKRLKARMMSAVEDYLQGAQPSRDESFAASVQRSIILFSASDATGNRFYAMRPDGSEIVSLTKPDTYTDIQWFPGGKKILYGAGRVVENQIVARHYTMNLDGSGKHGFGPDYVTGNSRVSPDGRKIVFISHKDHPGLFPEFNRSEIYALDLEGADALRLTHNLVEDSAPNWTPDGRIIFARGVSSDATHHQLLAINLDGTGEESYPPGRPATPGNWPAFSPDGTRLVFTVYGSGCTEVWMMDADGSNKMQLTDLKAMIYAPFWSPDGRRIVFAADHRLYILNADGSSGLRPAPAFTGLRGLSSPVWGLGAPIAMPAVG